MGRQRQILAWMLVTVTLAGPALAGSIWARGSRRTQTIYADDTARNVGDILTVVIDEKTTIENETSRELDKSEARSAEMSGTFDPANLVAEVGRYIFDFPKLDFSSEAGSEFEGSADFDTDRSMTDKISVVVEDVLPNRNLVVLGTRTRTIGGDTQIIQASGIVRPSDIDISNEVDSERVADFHIVFKSGGQEEDFVNPGWLSRMANALSPY
ncbi:MAG: flagellar basal body L-ring protein FlgH [Phycisphaerae bacterium]|nr:flagellar basal body L-ring protein FlgH [Phycisphaerae bacterium]